ncbi:alginate lyase family protein [Chthonobacter albigriseus]|uniref:alginate lyase family protein n=1 Tax=Chthonobacter albigriseus TaxID=1683161 RepID=UPI0015EF4FC3|nr:alginate lyase family protein [Chthonobacter albigriseus]
MTLRRALGPVLIASLLLAGPASAAMLALPFPVPSVKASGSPATCGNRAPKAVVSLAVTSRYDQSDKTKSTIDDDAEEAYQQGMKPIRDYLADVSQMATRYTESNGARVKEAACALAWMAAWAKSGALTDLDTRQAVLSSTRIMAGLSISYAQVKNAHAGTPEDRALIDAWLQEFADLVKGNFSADGTDDRSSDRQNHRYWAGFSVAAIGVVTGDRDDLAWGFTSYKIGACQIRADGVLPMELARGKRARDYHIHATGPLVMIAELAAANGMDAYGACGGAIHRLVKFNLDMIRDPRTVEAMTGEKQLKIPTRSGAIRGDRVAWLAPYLKRFPQKRSVVAGIKLPERLTSSNLGGNLGTLFRL